VPEGEVTLALAEMRNALEVGLAKIDGQLALIVQRTDQTDRAVEELEERIAALERTRWPLPAVATLASVVAIVLAVLQAARM
jgi:septal ring factor EnvC (AmiA/AmiB activator)